MGLYLFFVPLWRGMSVGRGWSVSFLWMGCLWGEGVVGYPSLPKEAGSCLRMTSAAMMPGRVQRHTKTKKWV